MKVGVGADHGGFEMKEQLAKLLTSQGHEVIDFGNKVLDRNDDYPDFAIPLAPRCGQWRCGTRHSSVRQRCGSLCGRQ
jgi:ribose 5-phosphate isomerase RpiB